MDPKLISEVIEFIKSIALSNHDVPDDIREDALKFYAVMTGGVPAYDENTIVKRSSSTVAEIETDIEPTYKKPVEKRVNYDLPNGVITEGDTTPFMLIPVKQPFSVAEITLTLHQNNRITDESTNGNFKQSKEHVKEFTGLSDKDCEYLAKNWVCTRFIGEGKMGSVFYVCGA
jgi:hypothetical protein